MEGPTCLEPGAQLGSGWRKILVGKKFADSWRNINSTSSGASNYRRKSIE